jgi:hypothetical protein
MRKMETQVKNYQPLVTPRQVGSGIEKFVIWHQAFPSNVGVGLKLSD